MISINQIFFFNFDINGLRQCDEKAGVNWLGLGWLGRRMVGSWAVGLERKGLHWAVRLGAEDLIHIKNGGARC